MEYPGGRQFLKLALKLQQNLIWPTLHPKDNFVLVPNGFLGPHKWENNVSEK